MKDDIAIACYDLSVGYEKKIVLTDVNISIPRGTLTVLIGANGSGKSTLLRTLAGDRKPLKGEIKLFGCDLNSYNAKQLAEIRAVVSTQRNGGGGLTVQECVAVGRYVYAPWTGLMKKEDKLVIDTALDSVGMSGFRNSYLSNLSDGERQKVMIARALAQDAPLIILDEPTSFLDVAARIEIMRLLKSLAASGKTIVLSTHDIAAAVSCADMILTVDADTRSAILGKKSEVIESGILNRLFASSNLHFDTDALDFR